MYEELVERLKRCEQFRCCGCEYEDVNGCRAKLNAEAADAIEELVEENKELSSRIDECLKVATTPFMVTTSDEVKSLGPAGPTNSRASIDVNK